METPVKSEVQTGVSLLQKAFLVLDLFQDDTPAWSQTEIVEAAGLPRSTASRLVRYFCETGYLIRNEESRQYLLGPAAIDLGRRASRTMDIRNLCRPILERLSASTGETVILTMLDENGTSATCIDQIVSRAEGLRVFEKIGSTMALHAGAAPKAILCAMSQKDQAHVLKTPLIAKTPMTITDPDILKADLNQAKARGYSISHEETYSGVVGAGCAFFGWGTTPVGSIAIAVPLHRIDDEQLDEFGLLLQTAAEEITSRLKNGYANYGDEE
ncbi:IclR family transcriptional regulator [Ochrobactrum vermis]|uniref:IclR family transcriptional regulator n=1 Tax=Ochrobactrum vermis TaxID=1827297 RepID=A0ABU8PNM0_9HYPH|nr:IclR family transcriptional regulator [Ochrobactrum vermis]PQZ24441.1 hypothetical protein CQZ93_25865 [Ochrobactrum vermis]